MNISGLLKPLYDEATREIEILEKEEKVGEGGIIEKTFRGAYIAGYLDAVKKVFALCHTNGIVDIDLKKMREVAE